MKPRMWTAIGHAAATWGLGALVLIGAAFPDAVFAQVSVTGEWKTVSNAMPINPIQVGLLRTGKVLIVAGSENDPYQHDKEVSRAAVWDPATGMFATYDLPWDVFCNGMAFLPDGRALMVGGTEAWGAFTGESRATVFDPLTERFIEVQSMTHGRWYATATAMSDGRILTFSGFNEAGIINQAVELYTIGSGWSPELQAPWTPQLYPRLHLLPDGTVFASGPTPDTHFFDPTTSEWTAGPLTKTGLVRTYGSSVLLPLRPPDYTPRVLIMGGDGGGYTATATAEIIAPSVAAPAWQSVPDMSRARIQMNATLLPDGRVLASGGSVIDQQASTASLEADLFDPRSLTWSSAGAAAFPRLYHSVALLLPDATVMTAGSNPALGVYDRHIEIWTPPYLFQGNGAPAPRPTITAGPGVIGYGGSFEVKTPDAADIDSVVLMRPGSVTHAFDMEQRLVSLTFTKTGTTLTISEPPHADIAPPGYYMLFILNSSGTPSSARFLQVSLTPTNKPPRGTITQPATDMVVQAGQSLTFAATASDPDGTVTSFAWIFPDGTPDAIAAPNGAAVTVTFPNPGTYVVSLTVVDNLGATDPSPDTRVITVVPPPQNLILPSSMATGAGTAAGCTNAPLTWSLADLPFQATDPITNGLARSPDTSLGNRGGEYQSFLPSFTTTNAFPPTDVPLMFTCASTAPDPIAPGVTTP